MVFIYEDTIRLKAKEWEIFRVSQSQVIGIKMNTLKMNDKNASFSREKGTVKRNKWKNSEMKATSEIKSLYRLCISID